MELSAYPTLSWRLALALGLGLVAVAGTITMLVRDRRLHPRKRCPRCGYERAHAVSEICSECGTRPSTSPWRLPPWSTLVLIALLWGATMAWPVQRSVAWSRDRGWSPPLPRHRTETLRRYSTGHVLQRLAIRNPFDPQYPEVIRLLGPNGETQLSYCWPHCGSSCGVGVDLSVPADIDGDGHPEVVFSYFSRGTECFLDLECFRLHVDRHPESIWKWSGTCAPELGDVDGDGRLEITSDARYRYVFAPGCCFWAPVTWVDELGPDGWRLDYERMRTAPPSETELAAIARRLRSEDWSGMVSADGMFPHYCDGSARLWEQMVVLVHGGNGREAIDLHEAVWPKDCDQRDDALRHFISMIGVGPARWSGLSPETRDPGSR
ncbi:MAG: VCBS repeat-containing protein [Planctomycetota bacterium]|nr:VCBS repeat-containing protein [Planctomycetota bacterium]